MTLDNFTKTQRKMLAVLADGQSHARSELHECLEDPLSSPKAVRNHIYNIRKLLLQRGETIICELRGWKISYRHVRLLTGSNGDTT